MDKEILEQYIDACELVKETEEDIRRLRQKKNTTVQTIVSGSNPDFPYQEQHFKIQGMVFAYEDDRRLRIEEKLLSERKANAEAVKCKVEAWMGTIPCRMQRIIRYKIFEKLSWDEVAELIGRKATKESVRKEFENFLKK